MHVDPAPPLQGAPQAPRGLDLDDRRHSILSPPAGQSLPSIRFDSSLIERRHCVDEWRAGMVTSFHVHLPEREHQQDFSVDSTSWLMSDVALMNGRFSAQTLVRTARHCQRDFLDHYLVSLADAAAPLDVDVDGRRIKVPTGQLLVKDMARPCSLDHTGCDAIFLFVPRAMLDGLLPAGLDLHGLMPKGPFAGLAGHHLRSLARRLPSAGSADAVHLAQATIQLISAALAPTPEALALNRQALDDASLRDARSLIDARLSDPALSAVELCEALNISRATLYRMFEPLGGVSSEIRKRRLVRSHLMLSARSARRSVQQVAEQFGFRSPGQFSRAFSEHFGYAPSAVEPTSSQRLPAGPDWQGGAFASWLLDR